MRSFLTSTPLSQFASSRDNNFNLIRFLAAIMVLYTHSFALSTGDVNAEPLRLALGMTWGTIAVDIFFITSGFLIAGSYFRNRNLMAFAWARILRITPALVVAMIFCVFGVGLYFTTVPAASFLSDAITVKFFLRNILLYLGVSYRLPGVFATLPFPGAINGSLWTLPHEIHMYTYLAVIGAVLSQVRPRLDDRILHRVFRLVATAGLLADLTNHFLSFANPETTHLFAMFFMGVAYYVSRDHIRLHGGIFVVCAAALGASLLQRDIFFVTYNLVLAYLIFFLAYVPRGPIRAFNRVGDYSYGIYIYAFPVQQSLVALKPGIAAHSLMLAATGVTGILAFLSWHLVEKRFLRLKGSYVVLERWLGRH